MGGGGSTTQKVEQTFDMKSINKSIYTEINSNMTESLADQVNMQKLVVRLTNVEGCSANFGQKIDASTQSVSQFKDEQVREIKNAITNDMQASASAALEKTSQMGNLSDLGLGGDTDMEIKQNVKMEVQNIIENTITTNNVNRAVAKQVSVQDGVLIVNGFRCAEGGSINWNQDMVAVLAAKAITDQLTQSLAESNTVNKLAASADATGTKKDGGIAEAAEGIGQGFANVAEGIGTGIGNVMGGGQMASAASACVLCIAILAALYFMMSPAGQGATKNFMKKRK
jgi:hypothetical protein